MEGLQCEQIEHFTLQTAAHWEDFPKLINAEEVLEQLASHDFRFHGPEMQPDAAFLDTFWVEVIESLPELKQSGLKVAYVIR